MVARNLKPLFQNTVISIAFKPSNLVSLSLTSDAVALLHSTQIHISVRNSLARLQKKRKDFLVPLYNQCF